MGGGGETSETSESCETSFLVAKCFSTGTYSGYKHEYQPSKQSKRSAPKDLGLVYPGSWQKVRTQCTVRRQLQQYKQ